MPILEGKRMSIMLAPKKPGTPKKAQPKPAKTEEKAKEVSAKAEAETDGEAGE